MVHSASVCTLLVPMTRDELNAGKRFCTRWLTTMAHMSSLYAVHALHAHDRALDGAESGSRVPYRF